MSSPDDFDWPTLPSGVAEAAETAYADDLDRVAEADDDTQRYLDSVADLADPETDGLACGGL